MTSKKRTDAPDGGGLRAAIYIRVSTADQAREGYSLDEQERKCRAYVEREGLTLVEVFREEGVSGSLKHRPALDRLVAARDAIDVVVVPSLDRLGRSTKNLLELYDTFEAKSVALVFLREHLDTTTPVGRLLRTILAAIAEFERELIIDRSTSGIGARTRSGKPWGEPKYGYRKRADGYWEAEPHEAEIIRRIYRLFVEDRMSRNAIAALLNREGVESRRKGGHWTATTIAGQLRSRHVTWGEFWSEGKGQPGEWIKSEQGHEPIVDEDLWTKAQALVDLGSKFSPSRGGRRPARHLFTGHLLRCGLCGEPMVPRSPGKGNGQDFYKCRTKMLGGDCEQPNHSRTDIDGRFLARFEETFLDIDTTRQQVALELEQGLSEADVAVEGIEAAIAKLEAEMARTHRDYRADQISGPTFEMFSAEQGEDMAALTAKLDQARRRRQERRDARATIDAAGETMRRLADLRDQVAATARDPKIDITGLRALFADFFEAVYLGPDGRFMRVVPGKMTRGTPLPGTLFEILGAAMPLKTADTTNPKTTLPESGVPE